MCKPIVAMCLFSFGCISLTTCKLQCVTCGGNDPSHRFKEVLSTIVAMTNSTVCVWSNHDDTGELQIAVVRELTLSYKAVVVLHNNATIVTLPEECFANVLIFTGQVHCRGILSSRLPLFVKHSFFVLYEEGRELETSDLTDCSEQFGPSRVAFVSLHTERVFALSSPLSSPRVFAPTTLLDVQKPVDFLPKSLNGSKVNVASFNCSPFVIFDKLNDTDHISGIEGEILKEMSKLMNFSINVVTLKGDKKWGAVINGSWNGGIGLALAEGTADIGVCNIWNNLRYFGIIDFGPPLNVVTFTFMVPRPQLIVHSWRSLVDIFSVEVWLCTSLLYLIVSFCYWLFCNVTDDQTQPGPSKSLLSMFGMLTLTSCSVREPSGSTRQLVLWWSLFVLLLTAIFNSSIAARLALPRYEARIDTVEQLVDQGFHWYDKNYTAHDKQSVYFNLANVWQRRWERRYQDVRPAEAVHSRTFAFPIQRWGRHMVFLQLDGVGLDYDRDLDDMRVLKETTSEIYVSFGFAKRTPFYLSCQIALQRMNEVGLVRYWAQEIVRLRGDKYSKELIQERDDVEKHPKKLSMTNLLSAFNNLAIGLIISFLVFLKEVYWK